MNCISTFEIKVKYSENISGSLGVRPAGGKDCLWGRKKNKKKTFLSVTECPARCGALPVWEWSSWEEECFVVGTGQEGAGVKALTDTCPLRALHLQLTWAGS